MNNTKKQSIVIGTNEGIGHAFYGDGTDALNNSVSLTIFSSNIATAFSLAHKLGYKLFSIR